MAELLRGAPVAASLTEELSYRASALRSRGIEPTLAIVRVGERSDDLAYERGAMKRAERMGLMVQRILLPADCAQEELIAAIERVNADASIHGCLMFSPLPPHLDEAAARAALDASKDVDGITPGSLFGAIRSGMVDEEAVVELLERSGVALEGSRVCVVGRSLVIGRPVSLMLQDRNATVTMCHTRTRNLAEECRRADVLVVAAGHAGTIGADCVSSGQVVGDVAFEEVEPLVRAITPVPGGVGAVTTAVLAKHVVEAAERASA